LKDPVPHSDPEHFEHGCEMWKRLVAAMSADPAPSHPAALFRVEGTHNSKREGEPKPCKALWGSDKPVDLSEIEAVIDLLPDTVRFTLRPHVGGNGQDPAPSSSGRRPKVDVDQRLADMRFEGAGQTAVHNTELSCTSSLLRKGMSLDSAVLTVLEEMQD